MTRWVSLVVSAVIAVTLIGAMWAKQQSQKPHSPAASEYRRCAKTCNALLVQFNESYPNRPTHEGDKQCRDTCWARMGKGKPGSASDMKNLWQENMSSHMRANQCAQACWRQRHRDNKTVSVGGWQSEPRTIVCK
jgi:hypothetical protein